jgi:hypothetical protein
MVAPATTNAAHGPEGSVHSKRRASELPGDSLSPLVDPPRKRARKGPLSQLTELPLDVLYEVHHSHCVHPASVFNVWFSAVWQILPKCHPLILLLLARTNKAFRALLMTKASKPIWEASLSTVVPPLPPCPSSMPEPQYTNLIFDLHCHVWF